MKIFFTKFENTIAGVKVSNTTQLPQLNESQQIINRSNASYFKNQIYNFGTAPLSPALKEVCQTRPNSNNYDRSRKHFKITAPLCRSYRVVPGATVCKLAARNAETNSKFLKNSINYG